MKVGVKSTSKWRRVGRVCLLGAASTAHLHCIQGDERHLPAAGNGVTRHFVDDVGNGGGGGSGTGEACDDPGEERTCKYVHEAGCTTGTQRCESGRWSDCVPVPRVTGTGGSF